MVEGALEAFRASGWVHAKAWTLKWQLIYRELRPLMF